MWAKVLSQVLIELGKSLGLFFIDLIKRWRGKKKIEKIDELAEKRKRTSEAMERARLLKDWDAYNKLFDEYKELSND